MDNLFIQGENTMTQAQANEAWINPDLYPFTAKTFQLDMGTMRYVDEGEGQPIVMVHGNPSWSFVYRKLIVGLSDKYRCIAPDHIGFGQSDKPFDWSYLPSEHAQNLDSLLTSLDLNDITLVVQDWGGPIGLDYAIKHPERVKRLVIMNTWLWDVRDDWYYQAFSGFVGGFVGRFLCRHWNFFVRVVVPMAYGNRQLLTKELHRHYFDALPTGESRKGSWVFPKQIIASGDWLADLWSKRERIVDKPVMISWGMKDIAFRENELRRWQEFFPQAQVTRFEAVGHDVQDEAGEMMVSLIDAFITAS